MKLEIDKKYNWKEQAEILIYIGQRGVWHQFEKSSNPGVVWCEVLTEDLHMLVEYPHE